MKKKIVSSFYEVAFTVTQYPFTVADLPDGFRLARDKIGCHKLYWMLSNGPEHNFNITSNKSLRGILCLQLYHGPLVCDNGGRAEHTGMYLCATEFYVSPGIELMWFWLKKKGKMGSLLE